jgi:hypothetical protein
MADKFKKILLTIKQKLQLIAKFRKGKLMTKLANDYGTGLQTKCDIKNKTKFMKFARGCSGNAEFSKFTSRV